MSNRIWKLQIWKLQRPLVTNELPPLVMAYTEGKKQMAMIPIPEEFMDELFNGKPKIYVEAKIKNGVLNVKHVIEEQAW